MDQHDHNEERKTQQDQLKRESDSLTKRRLKKQRQRTTAIALSILMIVSFGLIGFEKISNQQEFSEEPLAIRGSKSLHILSQEREREGAGLIANQNNRYDANEEHSLKEITKAQGNKIKALKRQLVDAHQKLHEVKAHLFTKGDPSDRNRLAEICQDLVEKEREVHEHQEKIAHLNKEREEQSHKINRMEHAIDALATMTDAQRSTKEQAMLSFQNQIEQLQNSAKAEKEELHNSIAELQEARQELKDSLAEKLGIIKNLENEVTWQYNVLAEKEHEIQSLSQLYTASTAEMNKELQDLIVAMQLEHLKNHNLGSELDVSEAKYTAQQHFSKSLEERIHLADEKAKQMHHHFADKTNSLVKEYLTMHGLLDVYADTHEHLTSKHKRLAELVREEKKRADNFQKDLAEAIAKHDTEQQRSFCLEQEMLKAAQQIAALSDRLQSEHNELMLKHQEIETLTYTNASLRDQLNERIAQLTANLTAEQQEASNRETLIRNLTISLELEKTRTQGLDHTLEVVIAENHNNQDKIQNLEEELSTKAEIITVLEARIQDKQSDINQLEDHINEYARDSEQEQIRISELHRALVAALQGNEASQFQIREMKKKLEESLDSATLMQDRIAEKKNTIDELQMDVDRLMTELDKEREMNGELQGILATTLAQKDAEKERVSLLEGETQNHAKRLILLQDTLADKHHEISTLLDQVQSFSRDLETERSRSESLQKNLESAIAKHDYQFRQSKGLEANIKDSEQQLQSLLSQLDVMESKLTTEQTRAKSLEDSLVSAISKHDADLNRVYELERTLLENGQKISALQENLLSQQSESERLQLEIAELNEAISLEQNRSVALQHSTEDDIQERYKLEKSLLEADIAMKELRTSIANKEQENQKLQQKLLSLTSNLDQEIAHSLELYTSIETGFNETENLRESATRLAEELAQVKEQLKIKEHALAAEEKQRAEEQSEKEQIQHAISSLQREKIELEQKYATQLGLVLRQQELVNQLSNSLLAQKERIHNLEKAQQESQAHTLPESKGVETRTSTPLSARE